MIVQKHIILQPYSRGIHSITKQVLSDLYHELQETSHGILHLFLQHTSAALTINEDADPEVRLDMLDHLDRIVPMHRNLYRHTHEGLDDMTSHILTSMIGCSIHIPIVHGRMALGTWQGIHLCEFREHAASRTIVATIIK